MDAWLGIRGTERLVTSGLNTTFGHRPIYICGEAATFIPNSSFAQIFHSGARETLIKSLSDFTLEFLCIARNNLTRIASYLRKVMTKLCIKILVNSDSAI